MRHRSHALRVSLSTALGNLRQKARDRFIESGREGRRSQAPENISGDPAPRRVYEDDHIIAFLEENESAFLVVTFGDRVNLADGEKFFGDVPLRKMGFSALGIMAKSPHWFQTGSIPKMVAATQNLLSRYPERIGYGITTTLASSETLKDLIAACRNEDLIRARTEVARKRRNGDQRLFRLGEVSSILWNAHLNKTLKRPAFNLS